MTTDTLTLKANIEGRDFTVTFGEVHSGVSHTYNEVILTGVRGASYFSARRNSEKSFMFYKDGKTLPGSVFGTQQFILALDKVIGWTVRPVTLADLKTNKTDK